MEEQETTKTPGRERTSISLTPAMLDLLRTYAKAHKVSASSVIEEAVGVFLMQKAEGLLNGSV